MMMLLLVYLTFAAPGGPSNRLHDLVEINSGTANVAGVAEVREKIAAELKVLGFTTEVKEGFLVGRLAGQNRGSVTLVGHVDTVFEKTSPFQHYKLLDDGIATGPGVIDDKGGLVVMLEGLRRYRRAGVPKYDLTVAISSNEETGSPGLDDAFTRLGAESRLVLGFEPALENGSIVQARRGNRWYVIKVEGREAHAGRAHKDGANACLALARKLDAISKLTDYARNVTVSVGHIEGGKDKFNIVCGQASAKVDTRFATRADMDRLHQKIRALVAREDVKGTKTTLEVANQTPPFSSDARSRPFAKAYLAAIAATEGKAPGAEMSGGSADTNGFAREGLPILDGLGPVGGKMHTEEEFVRLPSLETRAEALNQFLRGL